MYIRRGVTRISSVEGNILMIHSPQMELRSRFDQNHWQEQELLWQTCFRQIIRTPAVLFYNRYNDLMYLLARLSVWIILEHYDRLVDATEPINVDLGHNNNIR